MLARVFVSPAFLYRAETAPPGKAAAAVNDYEMANRLSYFLWSSMPDAELRSAADTGKLRTPAGVQAQARRMLRDDRVRRLATEFGAAWLHIHDFETLDEKSERHFPTFSDLRGAMYEESIRFFTDFFQNNRSVLSLLDADHTFLNETAGQALRDSRRRRTGMAARRWRPQVRARRHTGPGGRPGEAVRRLAHQPDPARQLDRRGAARRKLPRPPKDVPQLPRMRRPNRCPCAS